MARAYYEKVGRGVREKLRFVDEDGAYQYPGSAGFEEPPEEVRAEAEAKGIAYVGPEPVEVPQEPQPQQPQPQQPQAQQPQAEVQQPGVPPNNPAPSEVQ